MVDAAADVEWIVTDNEVEALHLELNLIKQHRPRYNVRYRDDKSYPYLAITLDEEFPRARVMRGAKRKGVRYYGPFAHAYAIRDTLDLLLRTFPMRTCSQGVFDRCHRRRTPVSAVPHRALLGALHRRRVGGGAPADRARAVRFPRREHGPGAEAARDGDERGRRRSRSTRRPPAIGISWRTCGR